MIETEQLTKKYGDLVAVQDLSFKVEEGKIWGLLGPNAAGKTTTMRILTGYLPATAGRASVAGYDVFEQAEAVKQSVKGDPDAVGYISLADLSDDVKAVNIDGVTPSEETVSNGTYKLQRPFLFLTKGQASGATLDFINWVMSSEGQAIVEEAGAVPVK